MITYYCPNCGEVYMVIESVVHVICSCGMDCNKANAKGGRKNNEH